RMPVGSRRMLAAIGIALALLLIGLALGGVFSGAGKKKANAPLTTETAPTTALTQPQTVLLPAATLKPGDHGNAVKQLQGALSWGSVLTGRAAPRWPFIDHARARIYQIVLGSATDGPSQTKALALAALGVRR